MAPDRVAPLPSLGTADAALEGLLGRERCVRVGGVHGGAVGLIVAAAARRVAAVLVVVADPRAADAAVLDVGAFAAGAPLPFPLWPHDAGQGPPDPEVLSARAAVLDALRRARAPGAGAAGPAPVVVAPLSALAQDVPSPAVVEAATLVLRAGASHPPGALAEHLALTGYVRVPAVETAGEFAARGGVLDVFPLGAPTALRLDFFGDVVEGVRDLDPVASRVGAEREEASLLALAPERLRDPGADSGPCALLDHLPRRALVVLVEPAVVAGKLAVGKGVAAAGDRVRWKRLDRALAEARRLDLAALRVGPEGHLDLDVGTLEELRGLASRAERGTGPAGKGARQDPQALVAAALRRVLERADRLVVHRRAAGEEERLRELLPGAPLDFVAGSLSASFLFGPTREAHLAYDDLADLALRERRPAGAAGATRPIQDFLELEVGEPVVHLHHGIGVFRGLAPLEKGGEGAQALAVEFAEGTTLYVPVARIDLLQRYVGSGRRPRLSKLGGTEWAARKAKVEDAVEEFAEALLEVQAHRGARTAAPVRPHPVWQAEFERAFPWKDTPDQTAATVAVKADLAGGKPMDRLLCGDVGYGKTEIALRAAFLVASAGRQVAVLVPTTVLCEQHRRTFEARLAPYPLVVRTLSRFRTPAEQREVLAGLADGSVDVVVGTHRLLSRDVRFADLALVVVDEEQRFGVEHKERLKELRADVDVLTLSATPIPRTLHMALLGLRDISNLTTPPPGRHPIETKVARFDETLVAETLRRELDRGGQVYYLHNRVFDLDVVAGRVMRAVPEARVETIHGQMDRDLVEERMVRFVRGEVDVLVSTTIVESGLDIPNANTMVIEDADRFGLSELHQLRGRVGREQRHAHCLLLVHPDRALSEEAARRLKALEEYSELGAGFRIAMRDLELRGAGNLLGAEQSGHIASVGYDLYCRMLADAVRRVRREPPRTTEPATVDVELPCGVPSAYVRDARETFRLVRRVSTAPTLEVLDGLREELVSRHGALPPDVDRLFLFQAVRLAAGALGVARVGPAEAGGLSVAGREGTDALDRLAARGVVVRRLDPATAYVPPPPGPAGRSFVESLEASLRALLPRLLPRAPRPPEEPPRGAPPRVSSRR
ncbi:MAG: transcription-repair coupling factor [Planctomycetes bacterium]|nr:transcription-repair coupling factor [Planctomycetota bacterium]